MACQGWGGGGSIRPQKATSVPVLFTFLHRLWRSVGHSTDLENGGRGTRQPHTAGLRTSPSFSLETAALQIKCFILSRGHLPPAVQQVGSACRVRHEWQVLASCEVRSVLIPARSLRRCRACNLSL